MAHELSGGDLVAAVSTDVDEIVAIVAIALTLERDPALQIELRRLSEVGEMGALSLEFPGLSGAIQLLPNGGAWALRAPDGVCIDLDRLVDAHAPIRTAITDGRVRATPAAVKTVLPFFTPERLPSRREFEALRRWAPLIEKPAYRACARVITLLEHWRGAALREPDVMPAGSMVERYYALLHTMAHLTLLASSPDAGPWLRDMAKTFTWVNWTPTFALVRERTVWLAAASARSAAAFGADVVPDYLQALAAARHPMKVFDALYGLVAIACADDAAFEPIVEGILRQEGASHRHPMPGQEYADLAYQTAAESLRVWAHGLEPPRHILARLGWSSHTRTGLATRAALTLDPTDLGTTGEMIGLAALPEVMRSPPSHHFPVRPGAAPPVLPRVRDMRSMLRRAWGPRTGASAVAH